MEYQNQKAHILAKNIQMEFTISHKLAPCKKLKHTLAKHVPFDGMFMLPTLYPQTFHRTNF